MWKNFFSNGDIIVFDGKTFRKLKVFQRPRFGPALLYQNA